MLGYLFKNNGVIRGGGLLRETPCIQGIGLKKICMFLAIKEL